MTRNLLPATFLFSIFISCKPIIEINGNGYRFLSDNSKTKLEKFDGDYCSNCQDTLEYGHFMEINGKQIQAIVNSNEKVVIKFLNVFCSTSKLDPYLELKDYFDGNANVRYYLISMEYDLKTIPTSNAGIHTNGVIYIMEDKYYGHKLKKIERKFSKDLVKFKFSNVLDSNFNDTYIFKSGELVFAGKNPPLGTIDSILYK